MREQNWPNDLEIKLQLRAAQPSFSVSRSGNNYAERRFDRLPSACSEKRDAIAVAIVMALDDYRSPEPAAASGSTSASLSEAALAEAPQEVELPAPVTPPPPVLASESTPLRDASPGRQAAAPQPFDAGSWTLYTGGQWLWAAAPSAATALTAGAELSLSPMWSVSAGGVWGPRAEHPLVDSKLLSAQIFAGQLLGCANVHALPTILQGCLGTVAGVLAAEGRGFVRRENATFAWAGVTLRAAAQWPSTGALALRAHIDGRVNLMRPAPEVHDAGAFKAPVGVFGADLGLDILLRVN
jgi:hypothetical protein